jgi:hypothetical protein
MFTRHRLHHLISIAWAVAIAAMPLAVSRWTAEPPAAAQAGSRAAATHQGPDQRR